MGHRCFISFKKEDEAYKKEIQRWVDDNKVDMIDKSLDTPIDSDDEEYIMLCRRLELIIFQIQQ